MFIVYSYVIILTIFKNIFRMTLVQTVLHNMLKYSNFYPVYPPYIFTLSVLDSTQLNSVLDMKGKTVCVHGVRVCRGSGAQFHLFLTLALEGYEWSASHHDCPWLDIMLEISCRHKHSSQLCAGDVSLYTNCFMRFLQNHNEVSLLMTGDTLEKLTQEMISFVQQWLHFVKVHCGRVRDVGSTGSDLGLDFIMTLCEPQNINYPDS